MDRKEKINIYINFILLALGLFFVFNYSYAFSVLVMVVGEVAVIYGLLMGVMYFIYSKSGEEDSVWGRESKIWISIICIIAGAAILIFEKSISDDGMRIILGLWMLLMGIYKTGLIFEFRRYDGRAWKLSAFSAGMSFVMCLIIIASYYSVNYALPIGWISVLSGVYFIIFACLGFGESIMISYLRKKNENISETVSEKTKDKIQKEIDDKNIEIGIGFDDENDNSAN